MRSVTSFRSISIILAVLCGVVGFALYQDAALPQANRAYLIGAEDRALQVQVIRVIDGDTIAITVPGLPKPLHELAIRINQIDTPEIGGRADCFEEKALGNAAAAFTRAHIERAHVIAFKIVDWGKFGGRIIADVEIDAQQDLGTMLVAEKLARPYDGGKQQKWC